MDAPQEELDTNAPTHYDVLGLTPALLDSQHDPALLVKRAYHRALLQYHPDKTRQTSTSSSSPRYTIDQVSHAFIILSAPQTRSGYDARLSRATTAAVGRSVQFQTGVQDIDLDDLAYDDGQECWHLACRCGNDRGYTFREADLVEVGDEGELLVGCQDCSLWLRVHFAVLEDHSDDARSLVDQPSKVSE
jgi:curved DNA-binding protein CbpA